MTDDFTVYKAYCAEQAEVLEEFADETVFTLNMDEAAAVLEVLNEVEIWSQTIADVYDRLTAFLLSEGDFSEDFPEE